MGGVARQDKGRGVRGQGLGRGGAEWDLAGIGRRGGAGREPGWSPCGCALGLLAVRPGGHGDGGAAVTAAEAAAGAVARAGMRRYLRVVGLCLACGFCSLLYAFSQLAVSLEEGAAGGRRPQAAAMVSWLADGERGGPGRGAGSAGSGRPGRYGPQCRARGFGSPRGGTRRSHHRALSVWLQTQCLEQLEIELICNFLKGSLEVRGGPQKS